MCWGSGGFISWCEAIRVQMWMFNGVGQLSLDGRNHVAFQLLPFSGTGIASAADVRSWVSLLTGPELKSFLNFISYAELGGIPDSFQRENSLWVSFLNLLVYSLGLQWILGKTWACSHPAWGCKVVRSHKLTIVFGSGQDLYRRTQKKKIKSSWNTHLLCTRWQLLFHLLWNFFP